MFGDDASARERLAELGFGDLDGFIAVVVEESDARWPAVQKLADRHHGIRFCYTEYSRKDLEESRWLVVGADSQHGYPQPEDENFGRPASDFDLSDYCSECGIGAVQTGHFRMRGEPKWGRRHLMQLNWVFDEYFAVPDAFSRIFAPLGIEQRSVLKGQTNQPLRSATQLYVPQALDGPLAMGDHPFEVCSACKRPKYLPFTRGFFPAMTTPPSSSVHLVKSREWFGSGGSAFRMLFMSQHLFRAIRQHKLRGLSFGAVASDEL